MGTAGGPPPSLGWPLRARVVEKKKKKTSNFDTFDPACHGRSRQTSCCPEAGSFLSRTLISSQLSSTSFAGQGAVVQSSHNFPAHNSHLRQLETAIPLPEECGTLKLPINCLMSGPCVGMSSSCKQWRGESPGDVSPASIWAGLRLAAHRAPFSASKLSLACPCICPNSPNKQFQEL